ncbi:MAG: hypothetical protein V3R71_06510, partial [Gemmatimonadales bacterium]
TFAFDIDFVELEDNYEENDTRLTAYNLRDYEERWLGTIDGAGRQHDEDWYEIYVTPGYERVLVDCRFTDTYFPHISV